MLQVVIAAGHFHAEDFGYLRGDRAEAAIAGGEGGAGWPGGGQPGAPAHDDCTLCFSLHVAGSAALPELGPPVMPSAQAAAAMLASPDALRLAAAPYLLFRTRAPPSL
ncbi:MAG TPA: hypothetical protein VEI03_18695 [Stellaceae bacterium]|nr:hypothetical protein [Stellaceae bacterium]